MNAKTIELSSLITPTFIPIAKSLIASAVLAGIMTSPGVYASEIGSQNANAIALADGDIINADAQALDSSWYGVFNVENQIASIDLAHGITINDNYAGQMVKGIMLSGSESQLTADHLTVNTVGKKTNGIFIDGNRVYANLGSGTLVNASGSATTTGVMVENDSQLMADALTINVNGSSGGTGLYIYQPGSSVDLGTHSAISTLGKNVNGVFIFGANGLDGSTAPASLNASQLLINTSGDSAIGINQQKNTLVNLGSGSTVITSGNDADGIYTFGDFRADALTINTSGTQAIGLEVRDSGVATLGAGSHITSVRDRGIVAYGEGATVNFAGSASNRNSISAGGNYAALAQNTGAVVNLAKTDITVSGTKANGLWAMGGGVVNGSDLAIRGGAGTTGISARSGGVINLSGDTRITMAGPQDNAIATQFRDKLPQGIVRVEGKMTLLGSVYAEQGNIALAMQSGSDWTGAATINPSYVSTLNVSLEQGNWHMTDNSQLSELNLNEGSVAFPPGKMSTLTLDALNGTGTFAMNTQLGNLKADLLNVTGNATGTYRLHISNSGKEPQQGDQDVLVVHTGGGDAGFTVPGGKVDAGTWEYALVQKGKDWYLSQQAATPVTPVDPDAPDVPDTPDTPDVPDAPDTPDTPDTPVAPVVPQREITPSADAVLSMASSSHVIFNSELQNLRYRRGDLRNDKGEQGGVWGRWFGSNNHVNGPEGSAWKLRQQGMGIGGDLPFTTRSSQGVLGAFVSFSDNDIAHTRGGDSKVNSSSAGVYATVFSPSGVYIDGTLKASHFGNTLQTRMSDGTPVSSSWRRDGFGGAVETGWTLPLIQGYWIEPWTRATAFTGETKKITLSNGMTASLGNDRSLQTSVGFNAGKNFTLGHIAVKPWVKAAVIHEFIKNNPVWINGVNKLDNDLSGTAGQYGAGVDIQLSRTGSLFAEADYLQGNHIDTPLEVNAGFRINF